MILKQDTYTLTVDLITNVVFSKRKTTFSPSLLFIARYQCDTDSLLGDYVSYVHLIKNYYHRKDC